MWRILNIIRILIVILITIFCSLFGILLYLVTWSKPTTLYIDSQIWSRVIMWSCGIKLIIKGRENVDVKRNYIFVSNHESLFDIPAVFLAAPVPLFFLAKKELSKVPVMGWFMHFIGMIFIDRGNSEKARVSMRRAGEIIRSGRNVITFPEGTRSKDGKVKLFRRGSFILSRETQIDLIPIGIEGAFECLAPGEFRIRPGVIKVNIGKPISASENKGKPVEQYASDTKVIVEKLIATV